MKKIVENIYSVNLLYIVLKKKIQKKLLMFSSNLYFATLWFVTVKIYVFRIGWRSSPHIWLLYMVTIFQLKYGETNTYFVLPPKIHKTEIFPCLTAEVGKKGLWAGWSPSQDVI